jgi:hypothetical protein
MEILLVRGVVRPGSHNAFLDVSARYNSARKTAGLPVYRRLTEVNAGDDDVVVFMCEFADAVEIERVEQLLESDAALAEVIAAMYEHLVPDSVTATTLRDID